MSEDQQDFIQSNKRGFFIFLLVSERQCTYCCLLKCTSEPYAHTVQAYSTLVRVYQQKNDRTFTAQNYILLLVDMKTGSCPVP